MYIIFKINLKKQWRILNTSLPVEMHPFISLKTPWFNILKRTILVLGSIACMNENPHFSSKTIPLCCTFSNHFYLVPHNQNSAQVTIRQSINIHTKTLFTGLTCSTVARSAFSNTRVLFSEMRRTLSRIAVLTELSIPTDVLDPHS